MSNNVFISLVKEYTFFSAMENVRDFGMGLKMGRCAAISKNLPALNSE